MALRPLVKQTIARDQNEVAEKLDLLVNQNVIDVDTIIDVEVTKFGTNQFLIIAVYYGSYVLWALDGLVSTVTRKLGISRTAGTVQEGLALVVGRVYGALRGLSCTLGLTSAAIARSCSFERVLSVAVGLASAVISSRKRESEAAATGLVLGLDILCGFNSPRFSASTGLASDVSYDHHKP